MFYGISRLTSVAFVFALTMPSAFADDIQPQAEILHWWSSKSESDALAVFVNEFQARGGNYYDSSKADEIASREEAIERMGRGYPATLSQWNAGRPIVELYEFGLIKPILSQQLVERLRSSLPPAVLDLVTYEDDIIAMPLNIHSDNWMWYSQDLLGQSEISLAGDWHQLFEMGDSLAAQDIPLFAVGNQPWQVRILFTTVLLSVSRERYKEFYLSTDADVTDTDEFRTALKVFNKIASYSESFGEDNWDSQIEAVVENRAAASIMGDWAHGLFLSLDLEAGKDYGCLLTSTDDPSLLMAIDTFVLGNVNDESEIAGQELMLDVVSDTEINLQFNALKGSVSPYGRPDPSELDICTSQVYAVLDNEEAVIPPVHTYFPETGEYADDIDRLIYQFWNDSLNADVDSDELIEQTAEQFKTILENITIDVAAANEAEEQLRQQCETGNTGSAATAHC